MTYSGYNLLGYLLIIISTIITIVAQMYVNSKYNLFRKVKIKKDLTGQEVARIILDNNGLTDIYVTEVKGLLSDHYDSNRKVIRLSHEVFHGSTVSSVSVAAHEVGHAIQDREGYKLIKVRGAIMPFVNFSSKFGYIAIVAGLIFGFFELAWAGIGLLLVILIFQLITLPVEFDASKRALLELEEHEILDKSEVSDSQVMLKAAALTYVAGVAATLLEILRMALIIIGRDNRD